LKHAPFSAGAHCCQIESRRFLPKPLWCICTSATREYATAALTVTGVPFPEVLVASEDVEKGKPHPDPYLLGAQKLGVDPKNCQSFSMNQYLNIDAHKNAKVLYLKMLLPVSGAASQQGAKLSDL
jgi:hypothetical protein